DTRAASDPSEVRAARDANIELAKTGGSAAIAAQMLPKLLAPGALDSRPDLVAELKSIMEACPPLTIEHALAAMRDRPDYRPTLDRIAAPTLIIVGEFDAMTPPSVAEEMHQCIRGSTISVIKDAGHLSPLEQPQQVSRAIRHFLVSSIGS
ncbi:MAG: alpha/beta hydrolase, partial [Tepidisphaeraceae bacterium]